jgi:tetratricopeptide (TPR) repeat protein
LFRRALACLRWPCRRPWLFLAILSLLAVTGFGAGVVGLHLWAGHHYRAARRALDRYRLEEAREHLECCLWVWPSDFEVRLLVAQTARRMGDYEEAERHLARCREIRGGVTDEVVLEQSLTRAQRGGMDSVMAYLRSLAEKDHPATPLIFEAMVRGYLNAYRLGDASAVLALWRKRSPEDIEANLLQGFVFEQYGPEVEAVNNYRRVLEQDPDRDEARLRLGVILNHLAQFAEAKTHLEYLAGKHPDDPRILTNLAESQVGLGLGPEAEKNLDRVLAAHPRFRPALAAKGQLVLALGRPAEAERWLRRALALDAPDYQTNFSLARCLRQQNKKREAVALEKRLKVMEEDLRRIRKIVNEDINRSPDDPGLLTEIGTILLRAGSTREGVQWLYSALRHNPAYAPAHRALAEHFERTGQRERAAQHRQVLGEAGPPPRPVSPARR